MIPAIVIPASDLCSPDVAQATNFSQGQDAPEAMTRLAEKNGPRQYSAPMANGLGSRLFGERRYAAAAQFFAHAASIRPEISEYACNEGSALLMLGRPREAAAAYLRSLDRETPLWEAHYWAWGAFNRLGISGRVIGCLREALHNDPAQRIFTPKIDRIPLRDVTLCAIDCTVPDLAARALHRCMTQVDFAEVKLLTSRAVRYDDIETIPIDHLASIEAYSRFVMKSLSQYVTTPFVLVVQWDGYVTNSSVWTNDFLDCDYLGARWTQDVVEGRGAPSSHDVGNGGFSLRSDFFLGAGQDPVLTETHPEDTHMCGTYRSYLEQHYGMRFADASLADRFSFEIMRPPSDSFGFHGCFNISRFESDSKWMRFKFLRPDVFTR